LFEIRRSFAGELTHLGLGFKALRTKDWRVDNPNHKGNVAELAIATEAARLGLSVLKPLTEHERYDLVLGIGGRLFRVQCKWGSRRGEVVEVRLKSCYHSPTQGYVVTTYDASEIDLVAVYCGDLDSCYLLPVDLVTGRGTISEAS